MKRATSTGRQRLGVAAAIAITVGAAVALGVPGGARAADTGTVVQAEGDAYAVGAQASLLGQGPINVGPESPALADVPPNTTQSSAASLVNCSDGVGPNCLDPLVDAVNVLQSNGDAGITPVTAHCPGAPAGFGGNSVTGGSACVTVASAAALNSGTAQAPVDNVFASGVTALSQIQGCDTVAKSATGKVDIAELVVGGTPIIGPDGLVDATPSPNTVIPLGAITVILNEEHADNSGHGWIVNAVHVFTSADLGALANVDLVIGHAHSEDMCNTGTATTPPANPGASGQQLPTGTKSDSTKSANPGETVTYTLKIATNGCQVVSVVDYLPSGFLYVSGSATGDLGTAPILPTPANPANQEIEFYNPAGWSAATLTETLQVKVPQGAAAGDYVNNVAGDSSPPISSASIACGSFEFSDNLPLSNSPIPGNNGNNPGVLVPRPPIATATQTPTAVPAAAVQNITAVSTPNTAGVSPAGWATPLALLALAGGLALRRRRRN